MEVELRVRIEEDIEPKLLEMNAKKESSSFQMDEYFKFSLDVDRKLVIRIRKKDNGSSLLTFKGSSKHEEDIAWQEWETKIEDEEVLKKLLLSNGLEKVVCIEKNRQTYKLDNFEINIDKIKGLGSFVEVELISDDAINAKKRIEELLSQKLGVPLKNVITQGYVPLMIEANKSNNFNI